MKKTIVFSFVIALAITIFGVSTEKASAASESSQLEVDASVRYELKPRFVKVRVDETTHYFERYRKTSDQVKFLYLRTYLRHIRPSEAIAQIAFAEAVAVSRPDVTTSVTEVADEPECYVTLRLNTMDSAACIRAEVVDLLKINWSEVNKLADPEVTICFWKGPRGGEVTETGCVKKNPGQKEFSAYPFTFHNNRGSYSVTLEMNDDEFAKGVWYWRTSTVTEYLDGRTYNSSSWNQNPMQYSSMGIGAGSYIWSGLFYESDSYSAQGYDQDGTTNYTIRVELKSPEAKILYTL